MANLEKYTDAWGGRPWNEEKWICRLAANGWKDYICPECDYVENVDIHVFIPWAYCPCCGTKLRDHYITEKEYQEEKKRISEEIKKKEEQG